MSHHDDRTSGHNPKGYRVLRLAWTIALIALGAALVYLAIDRDFRLDQQLPAGAPVVAILLLAFFAEYVDSSLGMGYGTTLTPVLILLGYSPLQIVPAVLLSEFLSGLSSGLMHHRIGNVNLGRGTRARKSVMILAACSVVGTVLAVLLAVRLPGPWVKAYIGVMILAMGLHILLARAVRAFSWMRLLAVGCIAAFNKGISGGGYGPIVTGGQIVAGVDSKHAVGITSLAEGVVCSVGLLLYVLCGQAISWHLAIPLTVGALLSVPAATFTVKVLPPQLMRRAIGYANLFLGILTLIKLFA